MSDQRFTSKQFFQMYAPQFNFELNEKQLVEKALERGFILHCGFRKPGGMIFRYNPDYQSKEMSEEDTRNE